MKAERWLSLPRARASQLAADPTTPYSLPGSAAESAAESASPVVTMQCMRTIDVSQVFEETEAQRGIHLRSPSKVMAVPG